MKTVRSGAAQFAGLGLAALLAAPAIHAQTTTMPSTLRYGSGLLDIPVASELPHTETELRELLRSISAEHGIGLEKRAYLKHSRSDVEIALMKTLKQALDPKGIPAFRNAF